MVCDAAPGCPGSSGMGGKAAATIISSQLSQGASRGPDSSGIGEVSYAAASGNDGASPSFAQRGIAAVSSKPATAQVSTANLANEAHTPEARGQGRFDTATQSHVPNTEQDSPVSASSAIVQSTAPGTRGAEQATTIETPKFKALISELQGMIASIHAENAAASNGEASGHQ